MRHFDLPFWKKDVLFTEVPGNETVERIRSNKVLHLFRCISDGVKASDNSSNGSPDNIIDGNMIFFQALITPIWAAPRDPPPLNTSATRWAWTEKENKTEIKIRFRKRMGNKSLEALIQHSLGYQTYIKSGSFPTQDRLYSVPKVNIKINSGKKPFYYQFISY